MHGKCKRKKERVSMGEERQTERGGGRKRERVREKKPKQRKERKEHLFSGAEGRQVDRD